MSSSSSFSVSLLVLALAAVFPAVAQQLPDAGRILQEQTPAPALPATPPTLDFASPAAATAPQGGAKAKIVRVEITGNSRLGETELLAALGDYQGQDFDLAGLQGLAQRITHHYQVAGYPFARAFVPRQNLAHGVLQLLVVEGRYGQVVARGSEPGLADRAQVYLQDLQPGEAIESAALERAALLLSDLPGVAVAPRVRPGDAVGTGDLVVQVDRAARVAGWVGLDNQGNRYTGEYRATAALQVNSPLTLGDQLSLRALRTDGGLWQGSAGYGLPLGGSGLRAQVAYGHTAYQLGKEFSELDARGTARVASAGLSYPLVRSQRRNLSLGVDLVHKALRDNYRAADVRQNKFSNSLPVALRFDARDSLAGGGITFGTLGWTPGTLKLDSDLTLSDGLTARSAGHFNKLNLDVARLQSLTSRWSLYGRFSGQWTRDNLDSSEDFGLGGPTGVRAYPLGEGYGDRGWLAQLEVRYAMGGINPFVFYDAGRVQTVAHPWQDGVNHRRLAGAGVGARLNWAGVQAEASVAWRTTGGDPTSDSRKRTPTLWASMAYAF